MPLTIKGHNVIYLIKKPQGKASDRQVYRKTLNRCFVVVISFYIVLLCQ